LNYGAESSALTRLLPLSVDPPDGCIRTSCNAQNNVSVASGITSHGHIAWRRSGPEASAGLDDSTVTARKTTLKPWGPAIGGGVTLPRLPTCSQYVEDPGPGCASIEVQVGDRNRQAEAPRPCATGVDE